MAIIAVNGYKHGCFDRYDTVYIGRAGKGKKGSALANPEQLKCEADREANLARYRLWLAARLSDPKSPQLAELRGIKAMEDQLGTVYLACFCAPKPCHGDVIIRAIRCGAYC